MRSPDIISCGIIEANIPSPAGRDAGFSGGSAFEAWEGQANGHSASGLLTTCEGQSHDCWQNVLRVTGERGERGNYDKDQKEFEFKLPNNRYSWYQAQCGRVWRYSRENVTTSDVNVKGLQKTEPPNTNRRGTKQISKSIITKSVYIRSARFQAKRLNTVSVITSSGAEEKAVH
jgi:hypothetical protein